MNAASAEQILERISSSVWIPGLGCLSSEHMVEYSRLLLGLEIFNQIDSGKGRCGEPSSRKQDVGILKLEFELQAQ